MRNARHENFLGDLIEFQTFDVSRRVSQTAPRNSGKRKFIFALLSLSLSLKGSWCNDVEVPSAGLCPSRLLLSRNWKQCRETKHSARRCSLRCMHNVTWITRCRAAAVQIMYRTWIKLRKHRKILHPQQKILTAKNHLLRYRLEEEKIYSKIGR